MPFPDVFLVIFVFRRKIGENRSRLRPSAALLSRPGPSGERLLRRFSSAVSGGADRGSSSSDAAAEPMRMEARDAARANHGSVFKAFPLSSRAGLRDPLSQPDSKVRRPADPCLRSPGPGVAAASSPRSLPGGAHVVLGASGFSGPLSPFLWCPCGSEAPVGRVSLRSIPRALSSKPPGGFDSPISVMPSTSALREPRLRC